MKTLCLFTNEFPYGSWEPYLETEVKYYTQFDKVYVFALQLRKEHSKTKRKLPDNCVVIPVPYAAKWRYLLNSFRVLFDKNLYIEINELRKSHRLGIKQIISLFVFLSRSYYESNIIFKYLKNKKLGKTCFYSYRFEYQPYVAMILKKRLGTDCRIISRAHRFDLYETRRPNHYIPCRKIVLNGIDDVYPCSDNGTNYLRTLFKKYTAKINTRFLGTDDHGISEVPEENTFKLVSCSTVTPVKRIDLIIESLSLIKDKDITWTHFGDGDLMDKIKQQAKKLPGNIKVDFRGNIENKKLLEIYKKERFDLFINVSESEGIPVSIMEAMSFGIPCLATNAGGTGEIVENGKGGILIPVDVTSEFIAENIVKFINLDDETYNNMRTDSRVRWENKFSSHKNYTSFVKELLY